MRRVVSLWLSHWPTDRLRRHRFAALPADAPLVTRGLRGARQGIGSLMVGYYDLAGRLHYAGAVGSGFSDKELLVLSKRLDGMGSARPPALLVAGEAPDRQIRWVRPELVIEVSFTAWSGDRRARHAVYLGMRETRPLRTL